MQTVPCTPSSLVMSESCVGHGPFGKGKFGIDQKRAFFKLLLFLCSSSSALDAYLAAAGRPPPSLCTVMQICKYSPLYSTRCWQGKSSCSEGLLGCLARVGKQPNSDQLLRRCWPYDFSHIEKARGVSALMPC